MEKKLFFVISILFCALISNAQTRVLTGTVKDGANNNALSGASIKIKGSSSGTVADENGRFKINTPNGTVTLEIFSVGYSTKSVNVSGSTNNVDISLDRENNELSNVVVTALGITRQSRSLTYSTQSIKTDELTTVKTPNLMNSLNGKVSGVQLNRTSGGTGGSVRITMRGDKSTRNSQPLFVIDGMPIVNPTGGPNVDIYSSMPDNGDILSTMNPEDIESINFLKGASASALYGSAGSNGVILITTKKGRAGISKIDFSSSVTFDKAYSLPELQYSYLQTTAPTSSNAGSPESWGAKGSSKDHVKDFFETGLTWVNSVTFSSGNERSNNFFSYANTSNEGVIPTSTFGQHNINFRNSSKFFDDKLTVNSNFMGSIQKVKNRMNPGIYFSPLTGLYMFPRGLDFNNYKTNFEYFSPSRYLYAQNWWNINMDNSTPFTGNDDQQNPYWILNRNAITSDNKNAYAAVSLNYALSKSLSIQARGNYNYYLSEAHRDVFATTQGTISGTNGKAYNNKLESKTYYADLILLGNTNISHDITLGYNLGTSISDNIKITTQIENGFLKFPNIFALSNLIFPGTNDNGRHFIISNYRAQTQSVFASAQLGFKNKFFLDLTDRHEWSSTLAFTPKDNYNYYSIGANAVLSDMFKFPASINFAKIRASYATVGNGIESNRTNPQPNIDAGTLISPTTSPATKFGLYLRPERNTTFEIGTEWRFLNNRLSLDATWYKSNIKNQFFGGIDVPAGSLSDITANSVDFSAGNIQNTGFEATISYKAIQQNDFKWTTTVNFSTNKNKIIELFPSTVPVNPDIIYKLFGGGNNYLKNGGSFGDIYGSTFKRDSANRIMVDTLGAPIRDESRTFLGNPNPKAIVGWYNQFTYKNFTLGILVDGKFGGKVLSLTEPFLDYYGVSKRSADARDAGGVTIPNAVLPNGTAWTNKSDAREYYSKLGGRNEIDEAYIYNATAIRLRELFLSYHVAVNKRAIKDVTISIIGSNLLFFKKDAPFDPEQVSGVNPGGVGVDVFGMPAYRSIGLNFKCSF